MKICRVCNESKQVAEFSGSGRCKPCEKQYQAAYRLKNKERLAAYDAERYAANPEKYATRHKLHYQNNKETITASHRKYHAANKEKANAASTQWYRENVDKVKAYKAENCASISDYMLHWRERNSDRRREYSKEYLKNNRAACRRHSHLRRVRKFQATPTWADKEFETFFSEEIFSLALMRESVCGFKWQVDHTVPLKSAKVCGLHHSDNLRLIPASENQSKGNRHWPDMW